MEDRKGNNFEPGEDPLVVRLVPEYLEELVNARQEIVRLEQEKEAFEAQENEEYEGEDEGDEGDRPNYAQELKKQIADLKNIIKEDKGKIKILTGAKKTKGSIKFYEEMGADTGPLQAHLRELLAKIAPAEESIRKLEEQLAPYNDILEKLKESKKQLKTLQRRFIEQLREARDTMTDDDCAALVLKILKGKLSGHLEAYVAAHRQEVVAAFENWWDKYKVTLNEIKTNKKFIESSLSKMMLSLGYINE